MIVPRKCTREEIMSDPRWRAAIKPLFLLMYELGVREVRLLKDGTNCRQYTTPDSDEEYDIDVGEVGGE